MKIVMKTKFINAALAIFCGITLSMSLGSCDEDESASEVDIYSSKFGQFLVPSTDSCSYWETADYDLNTDDYACYQFYNNRIPERQGVMYKYYTYLAKDGLLKYYKDSFDFIWSKDENWLSWSHYRIHRYYIRGYYTNAKDNKDYLTLGIINGADTVDYKLVRNKSFDTLPQGNGKDAVDYQSVYDRY